MCPPKFRGNSDDWLDDEENSAGLKSRSALKKPSHAKADALDPAQANATVVEVHPNQCRVIADADGSVPLCTYRRSGVLKKGEVRERTFVAVGDRVLIQQSGPATGVVEGICERRNKLSRPAPGNEEKKVQHVIAANLDRVVIAASCLEPAFSPGLVDRFLVAVQAAGISPLICVTKMDLFSGPDRSLDRSWEIYRSLGFEVLEVCAKSGLRMEELRAGLIGKTVLFCGQSGVGKTSLLRTLIGADVGRVAEISRATGKGRHTTTSAVMLGGPDSSRWIDSPGVREFGLAEVTPESLASYFPELQGLACVSPACTHGASEQGCQASALARAASYRRIRESLLAGEN